MPDETCNAAENCRNAYVRCWYCGALDGKGPSYFLPIEKDGVKPEKLVKERGERKQKMKRDLVTNRLNMRRLKKKGGRGEVKIMKLAKKLGIEANQTVLSGMLNQDGDIILDTGIHRFHVEVKTYEKGFNKVLKAWWQANKTLHPGIAVINTQGKSLAVIEAGLLFLILSENDTEY